MMVLILLTALLLFASAALAHRSFAKATTTLWVVATGVLVHVYVLLAVHLIGFAGHLSALTLGATTAALCVGTLGFLRRQEGAAVFRDQNAIMWTQLRGLVAGLWRAMRLAGLPLSLVVVTTAMLWVWWLFATTVSPPRGNSDALFYHEPIVAYMLQLGDLSAIDLPPRLQRINGFPRFCQMMQLWFAAFTGRTFVEWPNIFSHVLAVSSTYALLRKVEVQKSAAITWAFSFSVTPGVVRLTDGIMVDVHTSALTFAAAALVLVPSISWRTSVLASCAIGVLVGTKYTSLSVAFVLSVLLIVRMWPLAKELSSRRATALYLTTAVPVVASLAVVLGRNYVLFQNPLYPAGIHIDALGIAWKAPMSMENALASGKGLPPAGVLDKWTESPFRVDAWTNPSARVEDYGIGAVFMVWPLTSVAMLRALWMTWQRKKAGLALLTPSLATVWGLSLTVLTAWLTFPSFVRGRYYLAVLGLMFALTAWLFARPKLRGVGRQMAFAAQVMVLISLVFASREQWVALPSAVWARLKVPANERDFTERQLVTLQSALGHARLKEMTAGKKIGFDDAKLPGVFWNDDYTNEVMWLGNGDPLKRAEELKVDWLFLYRKGVDARNPLAKNWQKIGKVMGGRPGLPGVMYRRVTSGEASVATTPDFDVRKPRTQPSQRRSHRPQRRRPDASDDDTDINTPVDVSDYTSNGVDDYAQAPQGVPRRQKGSLGVRKLLKRLRGIPELQRPVAMRGADEDTPSNHDEHSTP